ncbi:MAG: DUF4857 domain-containing protein [Ignavibacteriaceae bacterium]|jgi:hypothetical protein
MLIKSSRVLYLLLIVFVASIFIPKYYWMKFEKNIRSQLVFFSPVKKDFLIRGDNTNVISYFDKAGNKYDRTEFEKLMPLLNYRQLTLDGKLPDSLNGVPLILEKIRMNNLTLKIYPSEIDYKPIQLFPMFESKSGRVQLEMPNDYFRITKRLEFIDCATNAIDEKKTQLFTNNLASNNFSFPAKIIAGNPTSKKAFDQGYFVVDSKNNLFHIKMVKGKPFCVNAMVPENLDIVYMKIMEMPLREFYGLIITKRNEVFLISYDHYKLIKLPLEGYNYKKNILAFMGDLFYRTFSLIGTNSIHTIVTDRNYTIVNSYEAIWKDNDELTAGVVASYIFPFTLRLGDDYSSLSNFYFKISLLHSFIGSIIFSVLTFFILRSRKISLKKGWFDILLVLITGIFGFIAVSLVKNVDKNLE